MYLIITYVIVLVITPATCWVTSVDLSVDPPMFCVLMMTEQEHAGFGRWVVEEKYLLF